MNTPTVMFGSGQPARDRRSWQLGTFRTSVAVLAVLAVLGVLGAWPGGAQAGSLWDDFKEDAQKVLDKVDDVVGGGETSGSSGGNVQSQQNVPSQPDIAGADAPRFDHPWVKEIQTHLATLGYNPGPADGVFGQGTGNAVKIFQQNNGLVATGLPTPSLMDALRTAQQQQQYAQPQYTQPQYTQPQYAQPQYAQPQYTQPQLGQTQYGQPQFTEPQYGGSSAALGLDPSLQQASQFDLTYETQRRLNQLGYDAGVVDGLYGGKTAKAIRAFQQSQGLPIDGQVTPALVASLRHAQGETGATAQSQGGGALAGTGSTGLAQQDAGPPPDFRPAGPLGPDLVGVSPATMQGMLVTGYPLTRGKFSKDDIKIGNAHKKKNSYELARYLDLAIIKAFPKLTEDPNDARNYALRFLTETEQASYLGDCFGSCWHSDNTPYLGWVGDNEFQREIKWRAFVDRFTPQLAQSGPAFPLRILNVTEVEFDVYDKENGVLPFRLRGSSGNIYSGYSKAAHGRFTVNSEYDTPKSIPASPDRAREILETVGERRAFLALHLTLQDPVVAESGKTKYLTAKLTMDRAALYVDPDLTQPLHEFPIHDASGVAAAGGANGIGTPAGSRIVKGPGGNLLLEFPMPPGMRPIRLAVMKGMPVLGYPVENGDFNPQKWKQLYGQAPEYETRLYGRLIDALRVGANPKLLYTRDVAENFAKSHLTDETKKEFLPCDGTFNCQGHSGFGANEIQRKPSHDAFTARYVGALAEQGPKLPFEYLHVFRVYLAEYDQQRQGFPINSPSGQKGSVSLGGYGGQSRVKIPELLPISAQQADALLASLENRNAFLAVPVAINGFTMSGYQEQLQVQALGAAVYADEALNKLIHEYPRIERKKDQIAQDAEVSRSPLWPHYGTLFSIRDVDGVLSEDALISLTQRQIEKEQYSWESIANQNNKNTPTSILEWQTLMASKPEFANGDLMRVFTDPYASWDFLNRETLYGLTPGHQVHVFMFSRDKIANKLPEFAARELYPVYRQHLAHAVAALPTAFYMVSALSTPRYDFENGEIVFDGKMTSQPNNTGVLFQPVQKIEYVAPGAKPKGAEYHTTYLNAGDPMLSVYRYNFQERQQVLEKPPARPQNLAGSSNAGASSGWQYNLAHIDQKTGIPSLRAVGFDRVLTIPRLAMSQKEAEKVLSKGGGFWAIVEFDAERATAIPGSKHATLIAKLRRVRVIDASRRTIASLGPESFPDVSSSKQAAKVAQAQKKQNEALQAQEAALAAEEAKKQREAAFQKCEASPTGADRVSCYEALCAAFASQGSASMADARANDECRSHLKSAKSAVENEKRQAEMQTRQRQQQCRSHVQSNWSLSEGMPLYDEAYQACLAEEERTPYGPDIVGLQLGMDRRSADALVQRRMDGQANASLREAHPFNQGLLRWTKDASRGIALFTVRTREGKELVAGISRRLYFADQQPAAAQIAAGLRKKYGQEIWSEDPSTLVWAFPDELADPSSANCHELADLVVPREGWNRAWAPEISYAEQQKQQQQQMQARQAQSTAHMNCVMAATTKVQPSGDGQDEGYDSEYMARINQEIAACDEKFGAPGAAYGQTAAEEEAKQPLMTRPEGDPGTYAKYAACGPVVISVLNADPAGKVKDASFVLFDPRWLATQPTIAFKAGPAGATADTAGTQIDF